MKLFKRKSEERRTCLKLKQNIPQFCKLIVVLMKKIKRAICCYMKRAMCCYMTTTWAEGIPRLFKRRAFVLTSWINICMCCLLQPWSNQHLFCNSVCHQFCVLPTNLPFCTRVQNSLWQAFRKSLPHSQTSQSRGEQQQEIAPPIFKVREMHVTGHSRGRQKNPL